MAGRPTQATRGVSVDTQLWLALQALADPVRLRIVALLRQREQCVCHLTEELGLSQGTISHHMGILRRVGLVQVRRDPSDARWAYYRLDREGLAALQTALAELLDISETDPTPAECCERVQ